jgi:SAM-dependent methyltransferase
VSTYPGVGGVLGWLADRFSGWARRRRLARLRVSTGLTEATRIVDIGCGSPGLLGLAPELEVTGVDLAEHPDYPGRLVRADATHRLPFADGEFDLAYVNSVIEHIPPGRREAFAAEVRRVARGWYVQTPALGFPVEPHSLLPFAHWLPRRARNIYWRLGVARDSRDQVNLLRRRELERLFGPAGRERVGPLTKSWISVKRP